MVRDVLQLVDLDVSGLRLDQRGDLRTHPHPLVLPVIHVALVLTARLLQMHWMSATPFHLHAWILRL